ncbi:uncharacterized protein LOC106180716 [Lingula anatina]|uniref:Uncharacterized protein LOC106180716 n=1 Tax=Lingula anatina TaxID=7574 RepID=A0A1S3KCS7_LINAN|nr:uncharacterized protein LOC106180716 [Lingula anatina]|eukprot:XP_013420244.1 uncharacterized protein LOC106180716 [Lingula anatina]
MIICYKSAIKGTVNMAEKQQLEESTPYPVYQNSSSSSEPGIGVLQSFPPVNVVVGPHQGIESTTLPKSIILKCAIILVVCGVCVLVLGVVSASLQIIYGHALTGVWTGFIFLLTGITGIAVSHKSYNCNRQKMTTFVALTILSLISSLMLVVIESFAANLESTYCGGKHYYSDAHKVYYFECPASLIAGPDTIHALLIVMGITEGAIAFLIIVLCRRVVCGSRLPVNESGSQVVFNMYPQQVYNIPNIGDAPPISQPPPYSSPLVSSPEFPPTCQSTCDMPYAPPLTPPPPTSQSSTCDPSYDPVQAPSTPPTSQSSTCDAPYDPVHVPPTTPTSQSSTCDPSSDPV